MKRLVHGLLALALLPAAAGRARAEYLVTDLGTLGGGFSWSAGLNDAGQVVGWSYTKSGDQHAFVYGGGKMTDLGIAGTAHGINSSGQIAGLSYTPAGARPYLYSGAVVTDLGGFGGIGSAAAINDA